MPATELSTLSDWLNEPTREIVAHLAKSDIIGSHDLIQLSDLVECDFAGYTPVRIDSWDGIDFDDNDYAEADSGEIAWTADEGVTPQGVFFAYLTVQEPGGTPQLWIAIPIPFSFTFVDPGNEFSFSFHVTSANLEADVDLLDGVIT